MDWTNLTRTLKGTQTNTCGVCKFRGSTIVGHRITQQPVIRRSRSSLSLLSIFSACIKSCHFFSYSPERRIACNSRSSILERGVVRTNIIGNMSTEKERETHVYMAKLSEQAERYDGMIFLYKYTFLFVFLYVCVQCPRHLYLVLIFWFRCGISLFRSFYLIYIPFE